MGVKDNSAGTGSPRTGARCCVRAARLNPDNSQRDDHLPALQVAGQATDDSAGRRAAPALVFEPRQRGCDARGYYEQGRLATEYGSRSCIVKLGCWGRWSTASPGGVDQRHRRVADVGGICIGARCLCSGQVHAVMDEAAGGQGLHDRPRRPRDGHPRCASSPTTPEKAALVARCAVLLQVGYKGRCPD